MANRDKQLREKKPFINHTDVDMLNYFLCPICGDYLFSRYECTKHVLCEKCAIKFNFKCCYCLSETGILVGNEVEMSKFEAFAARFTFQCLNNLCPEQLPFKELRRHSKVCKFKDAEQEAARNENFQRAVSTEAELNAQLFEDEDGNPIRRPIRFPIPANQINDSNRRRRIPANQLNDPEYSYMNNGTLVLVRAIPSGAENDQNVVGVHFWT